MYHKFEGATMKLKEILPMIRCRGYSNSDEGGKSIILCVECEEWTHVAFNENSGLLDLLGEIIVENIDAREDDIMLWIRTDDFNWFNSSKEETEKKEENV